VQNELSYAQGKQKAIFPILLEGENWVSLSSIQYSDVRDGSLPRQEFFTHIQQALGKPAGGQNPSIPRARRSLPPRIVLLISLIALAAAILAILIWRSLSEEIPSPTPGVTVRATSLPAVTLTAGPDSMILVPAGTFMMGSNNAEQEKPIHAVDLDAFWIDRTEVTNAAYGECVLAGACNAPGSIRSAKREFYYGNPEFRNYPVISVSWEDADKYCTWAGKHLPTEAQWEKAARGTDGRVYPWGSDSLGGTLLNFYSLVGDTTPVDEYPEGASFYGALNMAGNVWEWVSDWYDPYYYAISPSSNPTGPKVGEYHVLRGGSWYSPEPNIRATAREYPAPGFRSDLIGFRCAK
jgi:eukaryotic-like serine/threonine-protein kinase